MAAEPSLPPKAPGFAGRRKQPPPLAAAAIHENAAFKSVSIATPTGGGDASKHFIGTPSAEGILSAFMNFDDAKDSSLDADFEFFNNKCQEKEVHDESFSSVSTRFPNSPCSFALDKKTGESDSGNDDAHDDNQEEYEDDFEEDSDGEDGNAHGRHKAQDVPATAASKKQSEAASLPSRAKRAPPQLTEAVVCDEVVEAGDLTQNATSEDTQESEDLRESIRFGLKVIEESATSCNIFEEFATSTSGSGKPAIFRQKFQSFVGYYGGCSPAAQGIEQASSDLFDKLAVVAADGSAGVSYDVFCAEFFPSELQAVSSRSRAKVAPPQLTEALVCDEAAEADDVPQKVDVKDDQENLDLLESIRFGIKIIEGSATSSDVFGVSAAGESAISRENFRTFVAYYGGCSPAAKGIELLTNNLFDKLAVVAADGSKGINYEVFCAEFFPSEAQTTASVDNLPEKAALSEAASLQSRAKKAPPQLTEALVCDAAADADGATQLSPPEEGHESQDLVESIRFGLKVIEESASSCDIFEQFSMPAPGAGKPAISQQKFRTFVAYFGGCSPAAHGMDEVSNDLFDNLAVVAADGSKGVTYDVFRAEFFPSESQIPQHTAGCAADKEFAPPSRAKSYEIASLEVVPSPSRAKAAPPPLTEDLLCDAAAEADGPTEEPALEDGQASLGLLESIQFGLKVIAEFEDSVNSAEIFEEFATPASGSCKPAISRQFFHLFVAQYGGCSPAARGNEKLSNDLFDKLAVVAADGSRGVTYDVFCAEFFSV